MKKFMPFLSLCAIVLGFASCEKYDLDIADLAGTWEKSEVVDGGTKYDRLIFQEDGVFYIEYEVISDNATGGESAKTNGIAARGVLDDGVVSCGITRGTYTLSDNTLYLTSTFFEEETTTIAYKISIRKNTLTLTNAEELKKMKRKYVTSVTYTKVQ